MGIEFLILLLYKKRIKRLVEQYDRKKELYVGEKYLEGLKTKIKITRALKEYLFIPDFKELYECLIDVIANSTWLIVGIVGLITGQFFNIFKLAIFPFKLYIVKIVRKETLKRIEDIKDI